MILKRKDSTLRLLREAKEARCHRILRADGVEKINNACPTGAVTVGDWG